MFNNRGSFVLRLIGALLLIGLMSQAGTVAFRASVAQAPVIAEAFSNAAESGQSPIPAYGYGYPGDWMRPYFGFCPVCGGS